MILLRRYKWIFLNMEAHSIPPSIHPPPRYRSFPKGRYPLVENHCSTALRFALLFRYTSSSDCNFLKEYLPPPSKTLLKSLKSNSIQCDHALPGLRD